MQVCPKKEQNQYPVGPKEIFKKMKRLMSKYPTKGIRDYTEFTR